MSDSKHKVFVYGTLRENKAPTHILYNHRLFLIKGNFEFPSIQQAPSGNVVYGNLIEVDDEKLAELDQYEAVDSGLFSREVVTVFPIGNDTPITAFAYFGSDQLFPTQITSGDWFRP